MRPSLIAAIVTALLASCSGASTTNQGPPPSSSATAGGATDARDAGPDDVTPVPEADAAAPQADAAVTDVAQAFDDAAGPHRHPSAEHPSAEHATAADPAVFDRACGHCHPHGEADVGPRLAGIAWDEARMHRQIRAGGGSMRAISEARLPEAQMPALLAYLRAIHATRTATPAQR